MADSKTPVSPVKESVTTREEMDFDNDNEAEQETGREGHEEIPPQKPPRPINPQEQNEHTLIEAFPSIDAKVVKAVLQASAGQVEPAFNALLGMSDPDFKPEAAPPPPPKPAMRQPQTQLEADEMYARQLAEQYSGSAPRGQSNYNQRQWSGGRGPNQQRQQHMDDDEDRERNFFDDDLPEIGKNIQQGFMETQKKVNGWINTFRKRLDGEDEEEDLYSGGSSQQSRPPPGQDRFGSGRQNFGPSQSEQLHGIRKSSEAQARRSTEAGRYDADPHQIGDDEFERLELRDEEAPPPQPPRTSSRKSANPDLFKTQPKPPQSGPVDEVDAADRKSGDTGKARKWQPLTSVAPAPEEDNDPFSLGDDEDDVREKTEDVRKEDTERLKKVASESTSADNASKNPLEESERSGSINAEAAELLSGKKD
ncbi:ubiquitin-binding protein cue5 [Recurvomyces mirabilis]|uniref:Ubiquitin-binding protein cue5 n=1 Tax=Recurvomyces mirabilis TaxID=574656 RepID=A0AAE0TRN6_9PEZI|nr:ubiquitin-binding protein cue5 [Recurvomyces mirabilis]KAK5159875.1 ubiquitin-binding protein cue5 [Recurvomyces mirabilis]